MRSTFCILLFFGLCFITETTHSQTDSTDTGLFEGAAASAKLIAAKHEYNENNMRGALTLYREILKVEPDNAPALFWTARCHYALKKYNLAKEYLDKSVAIDAKVNRDIDLFYGQIHHRLALLDEAIAYYTKFATEEAGRKFDVEEAQEFIRQCKFAKELMASPVNVKVENMGRTINTRFDEYAPSVTADGSLIVFTSRRSDTQGGEIDEGGDYKFFEDVYYSEWNEDKKTWAQSRGVPGEINTPTYDAVLSINPQGNQMFVYRNNASSAGDIFVSSFDSHTEEWRAPEKLPRPVNTSYFEGSVSVTADGDWLYFISERPGGIGQGDIYRSERKGNGEWGSPKSVGPVINSELDEKFVFIHPNGKTLYFSSNGHQTMGSYDIFKSEYVNGQWSVPINLGFPINTVNEESTFSLTRDNSTLLIAAEYDDTFGERDLYKIDVSSYDVLSGNYEQSSFGSLICDVKDAKGGALKGALVSVYSASSEKLITSEKTSKAGRVKINLPGNRQYKVVVTHKDLNAEENVDMKLKKLGETAINVDFQLK
jgi:hypothetical protein